MADETARRFRAVPGAVRLLLCQGHARPARLPFGFGGAIIEAAIGDRLGYDESWDYPSLGEAAIGLMHWDGAGEPEGWISHIPSFRRISRSPEERDQAGNGVGAVGVVYVRH